MKILNLYAGIGGNRKLWPEGHEVTAVELNPEIAAIYQSFFPKDKVIVADAHQFLLEHYKEFDFIWSSPPCQSHSRIRFMATVNGREGKGQGEYGVIFPDMTLYQEIIFLKHHFKGLWVVENVIGYYEPLIKPQEVAKHYFWANFIIGSYDIGTRGHHFTISQMQLHKGFDVSKFKLHHRKDQVLRNCVEPKLGLHIWSCAFKEKQLTIELTKGVTFKEAKR